MLTDVADGVATLTLNNPDERNTLTAAMVTEIVAAMDAIEADESIGAVVVTGTAGVLRRRQPRQPGRGRRASLGNVYEGFLRIARSPLPTIAAVNGAAVGAGMNLALGCDVRLAARRARFDTRFLQIGIHPGAGTRGCCAASSDRRRRWPRSCSARCSTGPRPSGSVSPTAASTTTRCSTGPRDGRPGGVGAGAAAQDQGDDQGTWPTSSTTPARCEGLEPQLWSTRQPWFADGLPP